MEASDLRHAPAALLPRRAPGTIVQYMKQSGPQGRSGRVWENILPPPAFEHRAVQPVASRYTDWAIPALQSSRTLW